MWYPVRILVTIQFVAVFGLYADAWNDRLTQGAAQYDHGQYRNSAAQYEAALPFAPSPRERAVTLYRLGLAQDKLGQFAAAEHRYQEAITLFRASGDGPRLALALAALGESRRGEG